MQLTDRCDVWRMVGTYDQGKTMQAILTRVPCLRVPVSEFDKVANALLASSRSSAPSENFRSGGRESTDVFLLPTWARVFAEDELRRGRYTDINSRVLQYRYIIGGARDYGGLGYQDTTAVFCTLTQ